MDMQTNFVSAVAAWDNRQPLPDDVSNTLINLLTGQGFDAVAVSVANLVTATMMTPNASTNSIAIQIESLDGTTNAQIIAWVTAAILKLNLWTSPYLSVVSVAVN
jgi:hypothetical protein